MRNNNSKQIKKQDETTKHTHTYTYRYTREHRKRFVEIYMNISFKSKNEKKK